MTPDETPEVEEQVAEEQATAETDESAAAEQAQADADPSGEAPTDEAATPPPLSETEQQLLDRLEAELGDGVVESASAFGTLVVRVRPDAWRRAAEVSRDGLECDYLSFVSAIDWQPAPRPATRARRVRQPRPVRPPSTRRRLLGLLLALVVAFAVVGFRLVDLQAIGRERYAELAVGQRIQTVELPAQRGSIFDRSGNELAISVEQQTIWADPRVIGDPAAYAAALAPVTGVDPVELQARLSDPTKAFVYVARQVDDPTAERVRELDLPGVGFQPEPKRFYPSGNLAAPVLGWVGLDNTGLGGLESGWDEPLAGHAGSVVVERDPQGRELPGAERNRQAAEPGTDLVLTLDRSIQYEAERALTEQVVATGAAGGSAIVVDTQTGDVLAMASVDGATDEAPAGPAPASSGNAPLTDTYEPGSTNKVITIAGALEEAIVTPESWLQVPNVITIDGTDYEDEEPHDLDLQVSDIVRLSSNVGTIGIAQMLGSERFDAYLRAFGFGQSTGSGFPGEAEGIVLPLDQYNDTSLASMPVGNGIAVTAMQMLDVYTTIANGGTSRPPRLVAATIDAEGVRHDEPARTGSAVVSPATAAQVTAMLEGVVNDGTGHNAAVPGYRVAGKTGTAEKPPYEGQYVASFTGFAPAESPRLAAIVLIDEPQTSHLGGEVAAPVFAQIMQHALARMRVAPSSTTASGDE